jgi:hypothetical protein
MVSERTLADADGTAAGELEVDPLDAAQVPPHDQGAVSELSIKVDE